MRKKGESITSEIACPDIQKDGIRIDNIDVLNAVKMEINRQDIEQWPDIPIQKLWKKPFPYHVLIFIVPAIVENGSQPSVLNEELRKVLMNVEHYGIIPVFMVDSETWIDTKRSSDVAYLQNIQQKKVIKVSNVGCDNEELLDI